MRALRREARFWERAFRRWGVTLMVVYFVASIAEGLCECPLMRVHGGFREQEDVRSVSVEHGDHVGEGGTIMSRLLCIECEYGYFRTGWGRPCLRGAWVRFQWGMGREMSPGGCGAVAMGSPCGRRCMCGVCR